MIISIKKAMLGICNDAISKLSAYKGSLDKEERREKKAISSTHYIFLSDMIPLSKLLDNTIILITNELKTAEGKNDIESIRIFTDLFEKGTVLKGLIDGYFSLSEDALNQDGCLTSLKNLTELTLRKIINFKNTQHPPTP